MDRLAVGRRRFLAGLIASSPLFLTGCQSLENVLSSATPTPAKPKIARIAWPDEGIVGPYMTYRDQPLTAKGFIPRERHVDLEMMPIDLGSAPEQMVTRYASQIAGLTGAQAPDLVVVSSGLASSLAQADALVDLTSTLKGERWYKPDDFRGNLIQAVTVRGKLVALPLLVSSEVMVYDRLAFEQMGLPFPQPGWTWEEAIATARRLARPRREGESSYWGLLAGLWGPSLFTLAWQHGAELIGPKGGLDVSEPGTIEALELLVSLSRTHKVAPLVEEMPAYRDTWVPWEYQYAAMWTRILPACGLTWWRRAPNVSLAEMPRGQRKATFGTVDIAIGIPRNAPDVGHSVNALRGLLEASDKAMLMPPRTTANDVGKIAPEIPPGDAAALDSALESARFIPGDFVPSQAVYEIWQNELLLPILRGQREPARAAQDAQRRLDELQALEKRVW